MTDCASLTWPHAEHLADAGAVLVVPVGSTEQHGPHLPLTTDTDIAVAIAQGAARREPRLVVAPALPYGSSGEHRGFAGTLSIGQEAIELLLVELGRSASTTFSAFVFVSTHGGNLSALTRAVDRLRGEGRCVERWSPSWSGDLHAGRTETSLMLAIAPARVRLEAAAPGDGRPFSVLEPALRRGGLRSVTANGVLGDPTGADADEGRRLLDDAVLDLVATVTPHPTGPEREVTG